MFRNVACIDKLIAYSISTPGCPSLARVKQTQVRSLLKKFNSSNIDSEIDQSRKEIFRKLVRGRFQEGQLQEARGDDDESMREEEGEA